MTTATTSSAGGVTWDLTDLFAAHDDPRIEQELARCRERAEAFARSFRGTIKAPGGPAAPHLLAGVRELEAIHEILSRVGSYAGLLYAGDTSREAYRDLQQKVEQRGTEIGNLLLFFTLEWLDLEEAAAARLLADPALAPYRHYLTVSRRFRPHKLSEPEEKVVNEKDNTGCRAFARLHTELTTDLTFPLEMNGARKDLTLSEVLALLYRPQRDLRRRAMESLYAVLEQNHQVLTFVYDTLVQDHLTMDR
ncbi:MAG TPA: hypothetical protein VEG33_05680, partial [Streptosporangiaceae bacterium]|nr:hypothetical protein [Streptosporangiaceae bacterium]